MNIIRAKVAIVGDPRVGKSCLVSQLVRNYFISTYQSTLGIEYNQYEVKLPNSTYTVQFHLYDCTGFSPFREFVNSQISDVNFVLYVYDLTNLESFQAIKHWKETNKQILKNPNVIEVLVGNKSDLEFKKAVDETSQKNLANVYKMQNVTVSSQLGTNLKELFKDLADKFYAHYQNFTNSLISL